MTVTTHENLRQLMYDASLIDPLRLPDIGHWGRPKTHALRHRLMLFARDQGKFKLDPSEGVTTRRGAWIGVTSNGYIVEGDLDKPDNKKADMLVKIRRYDPDTGQFELVSQFRSKSAEVVGIKERRFWGAQQVQDCIQTGYVTGIPVVHTERGNLRDGQIFHSRFLAVARIPSKNHHR